MPPPCGRRAGASADLPFARDQHLCEVALLVHGERPREPLLRVVHLQGPHLHPLQRPRELAAVRHRREEVPALLLVAALRRVLRGDLAPAVRQGLQQQCVDIGDATSVCRGGPHLPKIVRLPVAYLDGRRDLLATQQVRLPAPLALKGGQEAEGVPLDHGRLQPPARAPSNTAADHGRRLGGLDNLLRGGALEGYGLLLLRLGTWHPRCSHCTCRDRRRTRDKPWELEPPT
mmetsp:Transcript_50290/g.145832  ORF Transcript_50290/g.145832 Transcript_50290/m.145832 type:complete len:231 (-) Transcript_50290:2-694(-)